MWRCDSDELSCLNVIHVYINWIHFYFRHILGLTLVHKVFLEFFTYADQKMKTVSYLVIYIVESSSIIFVLNNRILSDLDGHIFGKELFENWIVHLTVFPRVRNFVLMVFAMFEVNSARINRNVESIVTKYCSWVLLFHLVHCGIDSGIQPMPLHWHRSFLGSWTSTETVSILKYN